MVDHFRRFIAPLPPAADDEPGLCPRSAPVRNSESAGQPRLLLAEVDSFARLTAITNDLDILTVTKDADDFIKSVGEQSDTDLPVTPMITGSNPPYIMYTSGSTGFPKGAVMSHANVLNLIDWSRETYQITPTDILTNVNPLYFDNSVFDFYSALFTGAVLVPFSKAEVRDPKLLVEKVDTAGCTLWFSVPSLLIFLRTMKATDGKRLNSIRRFIFGGEGYPKAKLKGLYDLYASVSDFFNVSGPTECGADLEREAPRIMKEEFLLHESRRFHQQQIGPVRDR